MSWQATSWAERQRTGTAARKALLLILANYADANGRCWPSQETLARGTELSTDTIQRQLKTLMKLGIVSIERQPKRRGQWTTLIYQLHLDREVTEPHHAARSIPSQPVDTEPQMRPGRAALTTETVPQALRLKPSRELSTEPSRETTPSQAAERQQASQGKREGVEVIQNRIAQRLGAEGWEILLRLDERELHRLTAQERAGTLDDAALARLRFDVMHAQPP